MSLTLRFVAICLYICCIALKFETTMEKIQSTPPKYKKDDKKSIKNTHHKREEYRKKSKYLKIPARLINVIFSGPVLTTSSISWHFLLIFKAKFYIFMIKNTRFVVIFKLTISTDRLGGAITFICNKT